MNLLNQILPGAVTGKNGIAKSAETNSGSEGDPDAVFALELPVQADSSAGDPDTILNTAQETANPASTGQDDARVEGEKTPVPQEPFLIETGGADSEVSSSPKPEDPLHADAGEDTTPEVAPVSVATEKTILTSGNENSAPPVTKAGNPQAGLLANRAGDHQPGSMASGSAETAQPNALAPQAAPPEPKGGSTDSPPIEMSRPGKAPESTPAADITPKAWGWRKPDQPVKPAKTPPIADTAAPSGKAATDLAAAKAAPEVLPAKTSLLQARPDAASHGFTFRLPANEEMPKGVSGSGDQSLPVSTVKSTQPVNTVPTVAAGARVPALPIQNMAVEIAHRFHAGDNKFRIKLDPPELGRIDVRMDVARDGHVTAHLTAEKPETLAALSRDAAALERALNASGLDTDKNSLNFSLRQGNQGFEGSDGKNAFDSGTQTEATASEDAESGLPENVIRGYASSDGVDLHV